LSQASPIWILNAFVPGLFARNEAGNAEYYEQVNGTPGVNATPSPLASTTPLASKPPPPLASKPPPAFSPLASKPVTPGVNACDPWRQRPTESLEESLEESQEDSPSLRSGSALVKVADAIELELVAEGDEFGKAPAKKQSNRKPHDPKKKGPFVAHKDQILPAMRDIIRDVAAQKGGAEAGWVSDHLATVFKVFDNKWTISKRCLTADEWLREWENHCLSKGQEPSWAQARRVGRLPTASDLKQANSMYLKALQEDD